MDFFQWHHTISLTPILFLEFFAKGPEFISSLILTEEGFM